jgi:hypothetical protein
MSGGSLLTDWSNDQILDAIAAAMKGHNLPAVEALLRMLAVRDPGAAAAILDAIDRGRAAAAANPPAAVPEGPQKRRTVLADVRSLAASADEPKP